MISNEPIRAERTARRDWALIRVAAVAALAGASLRLAAVVLPASGAELLYFVIDVLLIVGLMGMFAGLSRLRHWLGGLAFAGTIVGFALIRTGDRLGGPDAYERGSAVLAVSLAVAGTVLLRGRGLTRLAGVAWLGSLAFGMAGSMLAWITGGTIAVALFCLGFGLGAVEVLRRPPDGDEPHEI